MTPEEQAREIIDQKPKQSGWIIQDRKRPDPEAAPGVAIRDFLTSTGPVAYALFADCVPAGVAEAKRSTAGQNITDVEKQSARYANCKFKWVQPGYETRFAYEATDKLIRFTDYTVPAPCSRFTGRKHCARRLHSRTASGTT